MQVRITNEALKKLVKRHSEKSGRSIPKEVEYLLSMALTALNKKL